MNYYICNDIKFLNSVGELCPTPVMAKHITYASAQMHINSHIDYVIMYHDQNKKSKHRYIISTIQKFVGENGDCVCNLSAAKSFDSVAAAFDYIDKHDEIKLYLGAPHVINSRFCKQVRPYVPVCQPAKNKKRIRISNNVRNSVFQKTNICAICGGLIEDGDFSIDHVQPLSRGGSNKIENLQPVHKKCNKLKSDLSNEEMLDTVTNIGCFNVYNSPTSDMSRKFLRAMVRGIIHNYSVEGVMSND